MEHTRSSVVVEMDAGWSDLGSWSSLREAASRGGEENVTHGDVLLTDVTGSVVHSSGRLVAAVGLRDQVVVETPDAVFVAPMRRAQEVKELVAALQARGREEAETHLRVYRPWGWYESLGRGERMQVKRIQVKAGASLSLQLHHQRAEHWVVVRGEAEVTRGEEVFTLRADQSTYIPQETKHRLRNRGTGPLEIIEVQTGSYVGEDDIVRFEDVYGRADNNATS
jgi:mannose-1-phosphate guanylyltransferase/mannose-1-phosphate guanylyltransferase/mannose-6-phosphate isomerase